MSVSMFSVLPVPGNVWEDKAMNLVIPFFPVVGMIIGLLWYALCVVLTCLNVPLYLQSVFITLFPFIISGLLHLDGFIDTADAVLSRRNLEEKRRILKDPHVGAFGVISLMILFMFCFAATHTAVEKSINMLPLVFVPVVSRCVIGAALLNLKPISENGYAGMFKKDTKKCHTAMLLIIAAASIAAGAFFCEVKGVAVVSGVVISEIITLGYLYRQLDGISGDLCGAALTVGELCGILLIALGGV